MRRLFRWRRKLDGKRALITGASSGIGRELALHLADAGADLVLLARSEERLQQVAEEATQRGVKANYVSGDVTSHEVRAKSLEMCQQELGGLDLLFNNAGAGAYGRFIEVSPNRLRDLMELNLFAVAEFTREATPMLIDGEDPAIINIGSILGCRGIPFSSEYCATKFALHGLTESVRPEIEKLGIEVMLVAPGTTETEFKKNVIDAQGTPPWVRRGGVPASLVARRTLRALRRRRRMFIPNIYGKLFVLANRALPRVLDRILERYG